MTRVATLSVRILFGPLKPIFSFIPWFRRDLILTQKKISKTFADIHQAKHWVGSCDGVLHSWHKPFSYFAPNSVPLGFSGSHWNRPIVTLQIYVTPSDGTYQFAELLPIEPQDQHQPVHRIPVNDSSMIVRFFELSWSRHCGYLNDTGSRFPYRIATIWTF